MVNTESVRVEIAVGELIDKMTILEIKAARIANSDKLRNVQTELKSLSVARDAAVPDSQELRELTNQLKRINESLWDILSLPRTRPSRIWRELLGPQYGSPCHTCQNGAGSFSETTVLGIRQCVYSVNHSEAIGPASFGT